MRSNKINKINFKSKRKASLPKWIKFSVFILPFAVIVIIWAELSGVVTLRKTEDMTGSKNAVSILWAGNSDIFVGELPEQLKTVAGSYGVEIIYRDISRHSNRGGSLSGLKEGAFKEIQNGKFDYVVLLDDPWHVMDNTEEFINEVRVYCAEAREHGVVPVLFNAAWALANQRPDEEQLDLTTAAYKRAAEENDAVFVNAAGAWIYAYQKMPDISLITKFDPRGPHPSKAGGFFTACLFAAVLFDLHIEDIPKESRYKGNNAIDLAEAAWEFARSSK